MNSSQPDSNDQDVLFIDETLLPYRAELIIETDLFEKGSVDSIDIKLQGDEQLLFDTAGALRRIYLTSDTLYQGIVYKANTWLELHPSGIPNAGFLAHDQHYRGAHYKGGKRMIFFENGTAAKGILASNHTAVIGFNVFEFLAGKALRLSRSGLIANGHQSQVIALLEPYSFTLDLGVVSFDETSMIRGCVSYTPHEFTYQGKTCRTRARSKIQFSSIDHREQSITLAHFENGYKIGPYKMYGGHSVSFFRGENLTEPGPLKRFVSPVLLLDQSLYVKALTNAYLYENGLFKEIVAGKDFVKNGVNIHNGSTLRMHENGNIEYLANSKALSINGKHYRAWSSFWFDDNAVLKCVHENGTPHRVCF